MKRITFLFFVVLSFAAFAQKPETIYSFARIDMGLPWYREQAKAWKKEIDKDATNANAWYNYYRVYRNLNALDHEDKRPYAEKQKMINEIVSGMEKNIPNSYEYYLVKWMVSGNNFDSLEYLKKADALGNGHWEHFDDMIIWGEVVRDINKRDDYSRRWFASGQVSTGFLNYNYNVLIGLKPNAIIFTVGDNDTYPLWILQSQGIRRDVTVLNMSLLAIEKYRDKIFKELEVEHYDMLEELRKHDSDKSKEVDYNSAYQYFTQRVVKHVAANRKNFPVYVAVTAGEDYTTPIEENLYLTGLTYLYSNQTVDNMAMLKRNFEQEYALDYIDKAFYNEISIQKVKEVNCNYIIPMIKLYDHYKACGDRDKLFWIKSKIELIAKGTESEKEIKHHLEQE